MTNRSGKKIVMLSLDLDQYEYIRTLAFERRTTMSGLIRSCVGYAIEDAENVLRSKTLDDM